MYKIFTKFFIAALLMFVGSISVLSAAEAEKNNTIKVNGIVYRADTKTPVANVQIMSFEALKTAVTDEKGAFSMEFTDKLAVLDLSCEGFFTQKVYLNGRTQLNIYMEPVKHSLRTDRYSDFYGEQSMYFKSGNVKSVSKSYLSQAYSGIDDGLVGRIPGVMVTGKGGMPGEGSVLSIRGLHSIYAENTPLIVVDGIVMLPDTELSNAISGFSKSMFGTINLKEVERVTLLTGADAAAYGSLGSNGVLVIDTEKGTDMETKLEFQTVEGVGFVNTYLPLMNPESYKSYISDLASTRYDNSGDMLARFPFLNDDPSDISLDKYRHYTKWQDEIYSPAFLSDNVLKVKGGDAVVKYALTVGFIGNKGVLDNTRQSKLYTRMNADISFSKKLTANAAVAFDYSDIKAHEQGIIPQTNPIVAAMGFSPLLKTLKDGIDGSEISEYTPYEPGSAVSNPIAAMKEIEGRNKLYDVTIRVGLDYNIHRNFKLNALFGIYYNFTKDDIFIPGKTNLAVAPIGQALNTVRSGANEGISYYFRALGTYRKSFANKHDLNASLSYQVMNSRREADCGSGYNTSSDLFKNLSNVDKSRGRQVTGYTDVWNWVNTGLAVDYAFAKQLYVGARATLDGSSSYGSNSGRVFVMPSAKIAWKMKNAPFLRDSKTISDLTLRMEYGMIGNSRYNSKYSRFYYTHINLNDISGFRRAGIPNINIGPEKIMNSNIGIDFSLASKLRFTADFYEERNKDMLVMRKLPSSFGFEDFYDNNGEMYTRGVEFGVHWDVLNKGEFKWGLGGNIAHYKTKVTSLGGDRRKIDIIGDDVALLTEVGESPFQFYGYKSEGVFSSTEEAQRYNLVDLKMNSFEAGDIHFTDNGDRIINNDDRKVLGSATPDFYGGFYSNMYYKGFSLFLNFSYSHGNEAYNGLRRHLESGSDFSNQAHSLSRRWMIDGQKTDIPKVVYGDPMKNNRFSSRWIEDASYLKLKEVTFSYETTKKFLIFTGAKAYITGENLFTVTDYLGMDPEFAYSYNPSMAGIDIAKTPMPKNVKLGLILNF